MQPDDHLALAPSRAALIVSTAGRQESLDYAELVRCSRQLSAYFFSCGLRHGDTVAILLDNRTAIAVAVWAAQRSGLRYTLINHHLQADEVHYIVGDCDAVALITSARFAPLVAGYEGLSGLAVRLVLDDDVPGFERYEALFADDALRAGIEGGQEIEGEMMLYSSGTTGRPKGILYHRPRQKFGDFVAVENLLHTAFGMNASSVLLVAGPLYHAAPISWTTGAHRLGATVIALDKYDALECLRLIELHGVTHVLMVPTHMVRLLKLRDVERARHALTTLQYVIHAAAPCPIEVKERMLDWLGPIVHEFYSSTEANGFVMIGPHDWMTHKGSVGKVDPRSIHIADEEGNPVSPGKPGLIWFAPSGAAFSYHKAEQKTRDAYDASGRSTVGDIGYQDQDGYLYLTDRQSNMVISGGVNIYPQEIENLLTLHPSVFDLAVIGVAHPDLGEELVAVVVATDPLLAGDALASELIAYCRLHVAHFKCPRRIRFVDELPRSAAGKLVKRLLRDDQRFPSAAA